MAEAPKRIWARPYRHSGIADRTFSHVAHDRDFSGATEYVRADLYEEAMGMAKLAVEVLREKEGGGSDG